MAAVCLDLGLRRGGRFFDAWIVWRYEPEGFPSPAAALPPVLFCLV